MKKIIAISALTLGLGAFSLPALAQADDYGQHVYTQNEPSRFAVESNRSSRSGARDDAARERINGRIDSYHKAY